MKYKYKYKYEYKYRSEVYIDNSVQREENRANSWQGKNMDMMKMKYENKN